MAIYKFRCVEHGDFELEQPMATTTRWAYCTCGFEAPKVLGGYMQYTHGRDAFHDGVEGTGETARETRDRWLAEAKRDGVPLEPVGSRWV